MSDNIASIRLRAGTPNVKRETTFSLDFAPRVEDFLPVKAVLREFVSGGARAYVEVTGKSSGFGPNSMRSKKFAVYGVTSYPPMPPWLTPLVAQALDLLAGNVPEEKR